MLIFRAIYHLSLYNVLEINICLVGLKICSQESLNCLSDILYHDVLFGTVDSEIFSTHLLTKQLTNLFWKEPNCKYFRLSGPDRKLEYFIW